MKKIFLMRHSIPEKGDMPNEQDSFIGKGKSTCCIKKKHIFQRWTDAFLHLIGEQWKRLNSSQITRSLWRNCMKELSGMPGRISG